MIHSRFNNDFLRVRKAVLLIPIQKMTKFQLQHEANPTQSTAALFLFIPGSLSLHRPKIPTPNATQRGCRHFHRAMRIPSRCRRSTSRGSRTALADG